MDDDEMRAVVDRAYPDRDYPPATNTQAWRDDDQAAS